MFNELVYFELKRNLYRESCEIGENKIDDLGNRIVIWYNIDIVVVVVVFPLHLS